MSIIRVLPIAAATMVLLATLALAQPQQQPRIRIEGPFAARDGDICVVCNSRLSKDDFAYKINGQRVTVMRGMEETLLASPLKFLKPQQGPGEQQQQPGVASMSLMATWGATYLLLGLMCGGACAYMAPSRGCAAMPWFWWGLLFSVPAVVMLTVRNGNSIVDPADVA